MLLFLFLDEERLVTDADVLREILYQAMQQLGEKTQFRLLFKHSWG